MIMCYKLMEITNVVSAIATTMQGRPKNGATLFYDL